MIKKEKEKEKGCTRKQFENIDFFFSC